MKVAISATTAALGLAAILAGGDPAGADPKQYEALAGVGSDTTQDVLNAFAGYVSKGTGVAGTNFTPVQSDAASGQRQVTSFNATGSTCITTKPGLPAFLRPNGSGAGTKALSRALDGGTFPASTTSCGGPKPTAGSVDFARSSSGVTTTTGPLTYIPFGRDALSFGYWVEPGTTPVTTLTFDQLKALHQTGPLDIGTTRVYACEIQNQSGTYGTWRGKLGVTDTEMDAATALCNPSEASNLQENDGNGLAAAGAALAGSEPAATNVQVVVGFSAANFISQTNGVVQSQLPSPAGTVDLGAIDALGKPYTGEVAGPIAPNSTFYASTTWGRDVYNVIPTTKVTSFGDQDYKTLFVGANSAICQAVSTRNDFGFQAPVTACGSTALRGPLVAN